MLATIFLDDVVEANAYVPAVPQLKRSRTDERAALAWVLWDLADLMYRAGIRYGTRKGRSLAHR